MSGLQAMSVCLNGECETEAWSVEDVCSRFAKAFVRLAGAVIMGAKPAAIFSLPMDGAGSGWGVSRTREALDEVLRAYAGIFPSYGVRLSVLYRDASRVYLMAWRPLLMAETLGQAHNLSILQETGYEGRTADELMTELRRRLVTFYIDKRVHCGACVSFPHEIGVFLGYPAEDVRGFLEGKKATCIGPWCAYGDERVARRRFGRLAALERACRERFAAGEPLCALFAGRKECPAEC